MIFTKTIKLKSHNPAPKLMDITKQVEKIMKEAKVKNGQVLIFARHTTAAIIIQEKEPKLHRDLGRFLQRLAPTDESFYEHSSAPDHITDGAPNGHSHCHHALLGASEVVPIASGKLLLGTFQRLFLAELDRTRQREIVVQVMGET